MVPAIHTPPHIIVRAGPSLSALQDVPVNRGKVEIKTDRFNGSVAVLIQDYSGPTSDAAQEVKAPSPEQWSREGDTWSIKVEGKFNEAVDADQLLFGNAWETPIRDYLPYGTAAALKFVHYVDPALSHDLYADKPWAMSPVIATMNYLNVNKSQNNSSDSCSTGSIPCAVKEDVSAVLPEDAPELVSRPEDRRKYFAQEAHRKGIKIESFQADFANGYLTFDPLALKLPIGMSFPLAKYWNGQPVAFVCRTRDTNETFFVVTFTFETIEGEHAHEDTKKEADEQVKADADIEDADNLGID